MKQTNLKLLLGVLRIVILSVICISLGINSFAQPLHPLSLHFEKDYQVRNFYNSSVTLSKLDLAQDLSNESIHPKIHVTAPGCGFKQNDSLLQIINNSETVQQSYIKLVQLIIC